MKDVLGLLNKILVVALLQFGCSPNAATATATPQQLLGTSHVKTETFVQGLEIPWSIVFTSNDRMLIAERGGKIRVVESGKLRDAPFAVLKDVVSQGESGLLGMTLHPKFASTRWLYVCYTTKKGDTLKNRVKRFRETQAGLADDKTIIDDMPGASIHDGCRLKFGPDGKLYVTMGESGQDDLAQKLNSLGGKILRLNDDGSIPVDNPFVNRKDVRPEIWSYGHRNPQGLDWQPQTNLLFETEHGPVGGDEVNLVERGKNYGWPTIHHQLTKAGMESPILEYTPSVAPSGASFYRSAAISGWQNNFFFACLRGQRVIRVALDGRKVIGTENLFQDQFGRIRDVVEGPDGALYLATSNRDGRGSPVPQDDRIIRVAPIR